VYFPEEFQFRLTFWVEIETHRNFPAPSFPSAAKRMSGGLKKFVNSDFFRLPISAKKQAGVTRRDDASQLKVFSMSVEIRVLERTSKLSKWLLSRQLKNEYVGSAYVAGIEEY
jgi:hypothetical protein